MADGAGQLFGGFGVGVIALTAVFALTSMANAGVLGTSRFLLAMSRDSLLPDPLGEIDSRFLTPRNAVLATGVVLLALIAFVPVVNLAKLASAFLILVFSLENIAVVALRESDLDFYDPDFLVPGYPVVQAVGVIAGVGLILQLGTLSIVGAVAIIGGGAVWYLVYGRSRTDRIGALVLTVQRRSGATDLDDDRVRPPRKRGESE